MTTLIREPFVKVLSKPAPNPLAVLESLEYLGAPEWTTDASTHAEGLIEFGGRLCYHSFSKPRPGGNPAYVEHILESGHGSVLEHANWSVLICGVSRALSHEFVRHRVGFAYSQLSQRFYDESDASFVVPPAILGDEPEENCFEIDCLASLQAYRDFVERQIEAKGRPATTAERKAIREAARFLLPNAVETRLLVTGNARAWRHLLELRGSLGADAEFRRLAVALYRILRDEAPTLFEDFEIRSDVNGNLYLSNEFRKV